MVRQLTFPYEKEPSPLFGSVYRPFAVVELWSKKIDRWVQVGMLVDTGADYTLLPKVYADHLGVEPKRGTRLFSTMGIGGREQVLVVDRWLMRIGSWRRWIPLGFLFRNDIPPLLGRQSCLDKFKVTLYKKRTTFSR